MFSVIYENGYPLCKGFSDTDAKYSNTKLILKCRSETITDDIVANHRNTIYETISGADSNKITGGLGQSQLKFDAMMIRSALYLTNTLSWIFIVLAQWKKNPRVEMSLRSDILTWFRSHQSLLLTPFCILSSKYQLYTLWIDPAMPRSIIYWTLLIDGYKTIENMTIW